MIDDIENSFSSIRPLEHPNNMVNLIKDYCRLNFPKQVGLDFPYHKISTTSPNRSMSKDYR
uniref:Uncharacterized protein n=1 Tax=Oryza punctata TaxID=4537 RepID=A0A0E0KV88_ORYPU